MQTSIRRARGFTLVELMIVVAIIAILAALALPAYQGYAARAKVTELVLSSGPCKNIVSEVIQTGAKEPNSGEWGCEAEGPSNYVASRTVAAGGVISLVARNIKGDIDGKALTLIPEIKKVNDAESVGTWTCGGPGTTIPRAYLPQSCRGS